MIRKPIPNHLRPVAPAHCQGTSAEAPSATRPCVGAPQLKPGSKEAFCAQTFPHVEAVYADALCLTGSRKDAASLVVEAYVRAFQSYSDFRRRSTPGDPRRCDTLAWLYHSLHAAFCDHIQAAATSGKPPSGGRL